jgi:hypothetical protein
MIKSEIKMKISIKKLRSVIREVIEEAVPQTRRGISPVTQRGVAPQDTSTAFKSRRLTTDSISSTSSITVLFHV